MNNVASDAEKIRIAARKLNGVALYNVYSVLINAVMRSKVILVHVLLKVIQPPGTAVDINRAESCRGRIDVHIENGGACERIANAGIQAVLTRIAKHERTESLDIIVSEERIGDAPETRMPAEVSTPRLPSFSKYCICPSRSTTGTNGLLTA